MTDTIHQIQCPYSDAGLSGDEFHFDVNGDGPARYNILHFKQVEPGQYRWINVGQYHDGALKLDLDSK